MAVKDLREDVLHAGATGCLAGNRIPQKMQDTLMKANALAVAVAMAYIHI